MIIGIDPDVEKNGVAIVKDGKLIEMHLMAYFELLGYLMTEQVTKVYIEAGWLNKKTNWHSNQNVNVASKIGAKVGANHQVGKMIEDMMKYLKIDYELIRPTEKKVTSMKVFNSITGWTGKSDQEQRDAAMLVIGRNN